MTEIQREEFRAAARERKRKNHEKKKSSKKAYFLQELIFFVSNRIKNKIYKTSSCFKASVCWRNLLGASDINTLHIQAREFESDKKNFSKRTL